MKIDEFKQKLEETIKPWKISIKNINLYYEAFSHPSFANENNCRHYERLEFLGDAVLGFLVGEVLYKNEDISEGEMTKIRANYVCTPANAEYSLALGLDKCLLLGKGAKDHNEDSQAVLADLFESFLGAMYLDNDIAYVRAFLAKFLFPKIKTKNIDYFVDYKSKLQEYVQAESRKGVNYTLFKEEGPPHNKTFEVAVFHDGVKLGIGKGKTKKEAEQNAAKDALKLVAR
ncbi:MAG: ribonuclease III [Bacilli bacterium]